MEGKKEEEYCQRGNANESVNTALFTAGLLLLMVCFKRDLPLFLVEQWRAWVFLVLNLVLLAIFLTSVNPITSTQNPESKNNDEETKKQSGDCKSSNEVEACKQDPVESNKRSNEAEGKLEKEAAVEQNNELPKLSKEELNERVEAFIAMFRQHLASDARKGRDKLERKGGDVKHMKLSSDGVNCFVLKVQG
ncbi:PREDICTED: uncharacterized protein LOC18601377 [Theobroma cacao]|uniref:Uncharacterized protein LOC18601377 n=1 Tax=Theobroma cacao TaxID=3641 RepID=A0AB32W5V4_THECC|nr:PREDICTED: uncharacterized protein LOC18601377 [Theobroma cacao]